MRVKTKIYSTNESYRTIIKISGTIFLSTLLPAVYYVYSYFDIIKKLNTGRWSYSGDLNELFLNGFILSAVSIVSGIIFIYTKWKDYQSGISEQLEIRYNNGRRIVDELAKIIETDAIYEYENVMKDCIDNLFNSSQEEQALQLYEKYMENQARKWFEMEFLKLCVDAIIEKEKGR